MHESAGGGRRGTFRCAYARDELPAWKRVDRDHLALFNEDGAAVALRLLSCR